MSHDPFMNPKILLVDDNPDNLILLEWILTSENFAVETATSGQRAIEALALSLPDAMLTDIQMPDMDGLELTRQVRQNPHTKGIYIMAVSANAMKENIEEAYAAGCDGYIVKPVNTRTFAASVREQLDRGPNAGLNSGLNSDGARPGFVAACDDRPSPGSEFLSDCMRQVEQVVSQRSDTQRRKQAFDVLHYCAGTAGVLGYPEIAVLARGLESQAEVLNEQEFVDGLHKLADLLEKFRASASARIS